QPVQIAFVSAIHVQHDKFGRVIGMVGYNEFFQSGKTGGGRFQEHEYFRSVFNFSLPPIMRFDFLNQVRAANEPRLQGGASKCTGGLEIRRSDQNQGKAACHFHRNANSRTPTGESARAATSALMIPSVVCCFASMVGLSPSAASAFEVSGPIEASLIFGNFWSNCGKSKRA